MSFTPSPVWSTVEPSYDWPRKSVIDEVDYVTHGRFSCLPPSSSKLVRIFMSSTFTDTYTERNLLMQNVYPKLQKLCKEKYDLDFQVVDMRWGVRNEATVDHSASELCMSEIDACKQFSIGPTFVALLSHRYGGRHVPSTVPYHDLEKIIEEIKSWETPEKDVALVKKWYHLDENALPHEYILQPILDQKEIENLLQITPEDTYVLNRNVTKSVGINPKLTQPSAEQNTKAIYKTLVDGGKEKWKEEEPVLKRLLRTAATKCFDRGILEDNQIRTFFQSTMCICKFTLSEISN